MDDDFEKWVSSKGLALTRRPDAKPSDKLLYEDPITQIAWELGLPQRQFGGGLFLDGSVYGCGGHRKKERA
jgi:hypothetical protein